MAVLLLNPASIIYGPWIIYLVLLWGYIFHLPEENNEKNVRPKPDEGPAVRALSAFCISEFPCEEKTSHWCDYEVRVNLDLRALCQTIRTKAWDTWMRVSAWQPALQHVSESSTSWFVVFAHVCGVNLPLRTHFKLTTWGRWMWNWDTRRSSTPLYTHAALKVRGAFGCWEICPLGNFRCWANITAYTYTNLDGQAFYTPRLYDAAYCA